VSVAAIVLAGGRSRRMGAPKHAVRLGGRTLLDRVLDAVPLLPTVVVGPPELLTSASARPGTTLTRERPAYSGPAAGIGAAIDELDRRRVSTERVLILSCDLAHPAEAVDLLLRSRSADDDGLALRDADGRLQWLCGLYRLRPITEAVARLRSSSSLDSARVGALLAGLSVRPVADPDAVGFDIDTPEDLLAATRSTAG
jgi:molybdopterin-guanine dinucleotide biosynthesis protein A